MNRIVTALLFLARDEKPEQWQSHPSQFVHELRQEYAGLLATHGNSLAIEAAEVTLAAPPEALNALLHNLVGHAASHTEHGEIRLAIDATRICIRYGSLARLPSNLDEAFKREYQPEHGGRFGLGLYLVGRLCARLGWPVRGQTDGHGRASIHIDCRAMATATSS